jgi:Flp pilus assembly protein TadD
MTGLEQGKALFEKKEFEKAIKELDTFLTEHSDNADALYTRAISYRKISEFDKSVEDLTSILKRLPNEPTLLCDRGISHFHNKNIEAAMRDMDKAVELDPENPYRYSSRAYIRAKIDVDGAIEDYKKAVELDPKDAIALNNLGLIEENAGRIKSAQKRFKASNELIGYDPNKRNQKVEPEEVEDQRSFGKIMLDVFSDSSTRKEYFRFLKSVFNKKTQ